MADPGRREREGRTDAEVVVVAGPAPTAQVPEEEVPEEEEVAEEEQEAIHRRGVSPGRRAEPSAIAPVPSL